MAPLLTTSALWQPAVQFGLVVGSREAACYSESSRVTLPIDSHSLRTLYSSDTTSHTIVVVTGPAAEGIWYPYSVMRRPRDDSADSEDDEIPLHHKRPFGSGLKRKKVDFVRAAESDDGIAPVTKPRAASCTIGDVYASIVLGHDKVKSASTPATTTASPQPGSSNKVEPEICPICWLPITTSLKEHEASLAHQVSMPHSHPPSALDRSRMGLRTLKSQGWDPDARRGLGLEGDGARYPIKTKVKDGNLGIGAAELLETQKQEPKEPPPRKLTGKELKQAMAKERQRAERLQAEIYGRVDVESYLRRQMDE